MPSMYRVTRVEVPFHHLSAADLCYHFGEYTSGGGYLCSETNRWISNLKKKPTVPANQLHWKAQAIDYWAAILRELMPPAGVPVNVTFVPIPGSKPQGHPEYDDRMMQILGKWKGEHPVDVRPLLRQRAERAAQHENARLQPQQIAQYLEVDPTYSNGLGEMVILVDDVLTLGASFAAAKGIVLGLPNVNSVRGVFLARTVWLDF